MLNEACAPKECARQNLSLMGANMACGYLRAVRLLTASLVCFFVFTAHSLADCVKPSDSEDRIGELPNLGKLKRRLSYYQCSGDYDRDVAKVIAEAQEFVEQRGPRVARAALVLDIDETSLSNWDQVKANDFGYVRAGGCDTLPKGPCGWHAWELSARAAPIKPTLRLFQAAKAKKVSVFFITGRGDDTVTRAATEVNLTAAGYEGWDRLIMRTGYISPSGDVMTRDFKTTMRERLQKEGFTIIANVGDQDSDLDGPQGEKCAFAEKCFKVPNPFYFIP